MSRGKNPRLKKAHTEEEYDSNRARELIKCAKDPIYFATKYVYIRHPLKGQILFDMYDYQKDLMREYLNNRYSIVLSARQTGKTETTCAFLLWYAIFKKDKTVLVVSNKSSNAMEIISKIQNAYEELPHWLKPGIDDTSWNKHECKFDNKSRIVSQTTSKDSGRGMAISLLYCDELAFVPAHVQEEFWDSVYPTLSTGGGCIISSTPNGSVNLFAQMWRKWEMRIGDFKGTFVPWDAPPGRDEKFKEEKIAILGLNKWLQEYECKFLSSDGTLVDTKVIEEDMKRVKDVKPEFTIEGQIFWKKIHPEKTYLVSCDPATGSQKDASTIEVFEFPSLEQVMEYRSNTIIPSALYTYLKKVLDFLTQNAGTVFFSYENNSVGQALTALYETDVKPPSAYLISEDGKGKLGFHTSHVSKIQACIKFKEMYEKGLITINSEHFLKELLSFVRKGNSYEAQTGATDDCVMGALIMIRMLEDIATFNMDAYTKLYGFEEQTWEIDENNIDDVPMPITF